MMYLSPELQTTFATFDDVMDARGTVYRALENRRTQRVLINQQAYFIKAHKGVGWKEIIKNIFQMRLPVLGATNEWRALSKLKELDIPAPCVMGYGIRGINPARLDSFIITRELPPSISLEDYCKPWREHRPSFKHKLALIKEVARMARILHEAGINHRDFYLCHFLLDATCVDSLKQPKIYLIDLHRAQIRKHIPLRWIIKDLAGLYFSSQDIGLNQRDWLRFMMEYRKKSLDAVIYTEAHFWKKVKKRGDQLYAKHSA